MSRPYRFLPLRLGTLALAAAAALPVAAQSERPDQVTIAARGRGRVQTITGTVSRNGLDKVEIENSSQNGSYDSSRVLGIVFGEVPTSYREAQVYFDRRDFENAAAGFKVAAGDPAARSVVQASARLRSGEALLRWGSTEPSRLAEAADELSRFLTDYAGNREIPRAQVLHARVLLLTGDHSGAAGIYREVFGKLSGGELASGYDLPTCARAGLQAARALLAANDTLGARETFTGLLSSLDSALAGMSPGDQDYVLYQGLRAEATLGDGYAELVGGNVNQARTFFEGVLRRVKSSDPANLRFGAVFGLGETLLTEGKTREAQFRFAEVSAIDHTDRDRVAQALLRQAECSQKLVDADFKAQSIRWLTAIVEEYGDTPSAGAAREMLTRLQ